MPLTQRLSLAALVLLIAAGSVRADSSVTSTPSAQPQPAELRAREAMSEFSTRLRDVLQEQLQTQGPVAAIDVCQVQAPRIAAEVMQSHGVRLGRTSERLRNPANAPADWQAELLSEFAARVADGEAPAEQQAMLHDNLPTGVALRVMRGIPVESPCTLCHGTDIAPEVAASLRTHYPGDAATGYRVGELRGALWVEVPQPVSQ